MQGASRRALLSCWRTIRPVLLVSSILTCWGATNPFNLGAAQINILWRGACMKSITGLAFRNSGISLGNAYKASRAWRHLHSTKVISFGMTLWPLPNNHLPPERTFQSSKNFRQNRMQPKFEQQAGHSDALIRDPWLCIVHTLNNNPWQVKRARFVVWAATLSGRSVQSYSGPKHDHIL
jgi:hypothetical protein